MTPDERRRLYEKEYGEKIFSLLEKQDTYVCEIFRLANYNLSHAGILLQVSYRSMAYWRKRHWPGFRKDLACPCVNARTFNKAPVEVEIPRREEVDLIELTERLGFERDKFLGQMSDFLKR